VVTDYVWDGRGDTKRFTLQCFASAWADAATTPVLFVNLLSWTPRWPTMMLRHPPGLRRAPQRGVWILNIWGRNWRGLSHRRQRLPVDSVGLSIARAARHLGLSAPVLMASEPAHCRLFETSGWGAKVWYCTDDYAADDLARADSVRANIEWTLPRADVVATVSPPLFEAYAPRAARVLLLPNGIDAVGLRDAALSVRTARGWREPPRPRVVYLGQLDHRVDWAALVPCVRQLGDVSFVFVGPAKGKNASLKAALRELRARSNTYFLGERRRAEVAWILAQCDLGLIPYDLNPFNCACSPLKALEYASFGLPVVTTPLPALVCHADTLHVTDAAFLRSAITAELERKEERRPALLDLVRANDWSVRVREFQEYLSGVANVRSPAPGSGV
jgi:glycosyltransferase involved in cell wall biosynthesis